MIVKFEVDPALVQKSEETSPKKVTTRLVSAHVPEPMYDKIREIASQDHTTIQALLCDAVNRLLADKKMDQFPVQRARTGRPRKGWQP